MDGSQIGAFGLLLRKGGVERSPSTALPTVVGRGVRVSLVFGQSRTGTAALPGPWATGGRLFPPVGRCLSAGAEGGFCGPLSGTCEAIRKPRDSLACAPQPQGPSAALLSAAPWACVWC